MHHQCLVTTTSPQQFMQQESWLVSKTLQESIIPVFWVTGLSLTQHIHSDCWCTEWASHITCTKSDRTEGWYIIQYTIRLLHYIHEPTAIHVPIMLCYYFESLTEHIPCRLGYRHGPPLVPCPHVCWLQVWFSHSAFTMSSWLYTWAY